jgi:ComF family protein
MKTTISFWTRLFDLISPRQCVVCGERLTVTEQVVCGKCNLHLPRTGYQYSPYDNVMAKLFWGQIPIERATAMFFYESHARTANIIYELKYKNHPEIGEVMGRMAAKELLMTDFFEGIEAIVPVPLAKKRERQRGYNQSLEIAKGIREATALPIYNKVVARTVFKGSQTNRGRWDRNENVEKAFLLTDGESVRGKHLLLVDDVVTTGATVIACAKELVKAGDVKVSVLSLGFAKS